MLVACCLCACVGCAGGDEAPEPVPTPAPEERWVPQAGASWQYQLQGHIDAFVDVQIYDVDLFDVDPALVDELHRAGRNAICYVSVGTYENWRRDAARFPPDVIGEPLANWRGEAWLDIRRLDVLEPVMASRFDLCRDKGFAAVDPDNLDGYRQDTGFRLTPEDQLRFNRMIVRLAHERSLAVGLKNDVGQIDELVGEFDFAVNESCVDQDECELLRPFVDAGKAVLHVEYELSTAYFCDITASLGFSSIRKPRDLSAPLEAC